MELFHNNFSVYSQNFRLVLRESGLKPIDII